MTSRLSAKGTALEIKYIDSKKVDMLEESTVTRNHKIRDMKHIFETESLSVLQLKEKSTRLLGSCKDGIDIWQTS